ncbi:HET-domain-containing protein [Pseudovirgaria hyperparasitica]|uniref:HET-domain-containing protein n=1 Tax=Pseudovirgaria hyperparasitica TaxID=470096 RepID=A0A6A6W2M2_9PEZI|nr:HET-domain-containing protein [Pseudovirgaria hyperparasitica]KAF2756264.1 HET-domain-containing protein [Pseudovirgaria hyperparasitica]
MTGDGISHIHYVLSHQIPPQVTTATVVIRDAHESYSAEQVCADCQHLSGVLSTEALRIDARLRTSRTIADIREGALQGCRLCSIFMGQFDTVAKDLLDVHRRKRAHITTRYYEDDGHVAMTFRWRSDCWRALKIKSFTPFLFLRTTLPSLGPGVWPMSSHTDNDTTWSIARRWLSQCLDGHSRCDLASPFRRLPSRLIDIGDSEEGIFPRLCATQNLDPQTPYFTMSHCWGGLIPSRLLSSNLQEYLQQLPLHFISLKFRETMACVKKLGYRYIWIDCLCIMQDSASDWAAESVYMGDFYRNALCNIAANNSDSYEHSLFTTRNTLAIEPCYVNVMESSGVTSAFFCITADIWSRKVAEGPIIRRGWVVQELALAPRILYFDQDQLYWQCRSSRACEQYPEHDLSHSEHITFIPQAPVSSVSHTPWMLQSDIKADRRSERAELEPGSTWRTIMARYSECALSFEEKDKLIAISGVARRFGSASEYFAGMWKADLPISLLWKTYLQWRGGGSRRRLASGTPTWSWASISATLDFPDTNKSRPDMVVELQDTPFPSYKAEVIEVFTQKDTDDPFGQVSKGHICLDGALTNQKVNPLPNPRNDFLNGRADRYSDGEFVIACQFDSPTDTMSPGVYFFLVGDAYIHPGGWITAGLMLQRTLSKGEYRRLGVFWINPGPDLAIKGYDQKRSMASFMQSCRGFAETSDTTEWLERGRRRTHSCTIKII